MPRIEETEKDVLFNLGRIHANKFCVQNKIPIPQIVAVPKSEWHFGTCAFYRWDRGVKICVEECSWLAGESLSRNWNWPGATTDREPFGVIAHELGHHCDWLTGEKKWEYGSEYSEQVMDKSGEAPITSYCPNPAEWFAEMFRLFVTNAYLLSKLRPKTFKLLVNDWTPITKQNWQQQLEEYGYKVPARILNNLIKKATNAH